MTWDEAYRASPADRLAGCDETAEMPAGEPGLDELLDDPIMALLWRGDRLDPGTARATVMGLRELLRRRHGQGPSCAVLV